MSLSFLLSPSFRLSLFLGRGRAASSLGREFVRANDRRGVTARFSDAANFSGWNVRRASFGSSRVLSDLETESRFENLREERDLFPSTDEISSKIVSALVRSNMIER